MFAGIEVHSEAHELTLDEVGAVLWRERGEFLQLDILHACAAVRVVVGDVRSQPVNTTGAAVRLSGLREVKARW